MRLIKIKSKQNKMPDCQLHALVNSGVFKKYKHVRILNRTIAKMLKPFILKSELDRGIYCSYAFTTMALKLKRGRVPIPCNKYKWLSQLPKKGTFVMSIDFGLKSAVHAVAFKNGQVLDSHFEIGLPVEYYENKRIIKGTCYKVA